MGARPLSPEQQERLSELAFLLEADTNVRAVVARLGFPSPEAAEMLARRGGRRDLAAILNVYAGCTDPYSEPAGRFYDRIGRTYQLPTHSSPHKRSTRA